MKSLSVWDPPPILEKDQGFFFSFFIRMDVPQIPMPPLSSFIFIIILFLLGKVFDLSPTYSFTREIGFSTYL
jgi:hypothetical protein